MSSDSGKLLAISSTLLHALFLSQVAGPQISLGVDKAGRLLETTERDPAGGRGDGSVSTLTRDGDEATVGRLESGNVVLRRARASGLGRRVSPWINGPVAYISSCPVQRDSQGTHTERVATGHGGDGDTISVSGSLGQYTGVRLAVGSLVRVHVGDKGRASVRRAVDRSTTYERDARGLMRLAPFDSHDATLANTVLVRHGLGQQVSVPTVAEQGKVRLVQEG